MVQEVAEAALTPEGVLLGVSAREGEAVAHADTTEESLGAAEAERGALGVFTALPVARTAVGVEEEDTECVGEGVAGPEPVIVGEAEGVAEGQGKFAVEEGVAVESAVGEPWLEDGVEEGEGVGVPLAGPTVSVALYDSAGVALEQNVATLLLLTLGVGAALEEGNAEVEGQGEEEKDAIAPPREAVGQRLCVAGSIREGEESREAVAAAGPRERLGCVVLVVLGQGVAEGSRESVPVMDTEGVAVEEIELVGEGVVEGVMAPACTVGVREGDWDWDREGVKEPLRVVPGDCEEVAVGTTVMLASPLVDTVMEGEIVE